jgi:hypothetical protein
MQISKKQYLVIFGVIIFFVAMASLALFRLRDRFLSVPLPPAAPYVAPPVLQEPTLASPTPASPEAPAVDVELPAEVNLKIPFTSQAPHQNWDLPYKEFCEEASILMAVSYVNNDPILGPDDADAKLLAIKNFEEKKLGFHEDTDAEDTAKIMREFYSLEKVEILNDPTAKDIKKALANGKAVIAPFAGRELGNPNYHQPGPLYHMLVIKGYRKNGDFITNDPGTRKGADYIYQEKVIMDAIHDWNDGDVNNGKKVIIIVG